MDENPPPYVFDVRALFAWSQATGNVLGIVLAGVMTGTIMVYGRVWKEFCDVYSDEAETLAAHEFDRCRVTKEHRLAASALVAKADDSFAPKGPYDDGVELCVAGIASCSGGTIITDERRKPSYQAIDGLSVLTFEELLDLL